VGFGSLFLVVIMQKMRKRREGAEKPRKGA